MLKTSPVLTNSASPSPASLRRGHAHSHAHSRAHSRPHAHTHAAHASNFHAHYSNDCATAAAVEGPVPRRSSSRSASSASLSASGSASASMKSPAAASLRVEHNAARSDISSAADGPPARDSAAAQQQITHEPTSPPPQPRTLSHQSTTTTATAIAAPPVDATMSSVASNPSNALSPGKRRGSPADVPKLDPSATATNPKDETLPKTSKRAKAEDNPPKILPHRYEFCAVEDIVELIAHMIGELIATNDAIRPSNGGLTRFHSR